MSDKCYRLMREGREELGTFDRRDEVERIAEYDARSRGYGLRWLSSFGRAHGKPTSGGRDVFSYTIEDVLCE